MRPSEDSGGRFVKRYATAEKAREAMRRSRMARAAGVRTPAAHAGPGPRSLGFARIEGQSGVGLLALCGLADLLGPLRTLHGMSPFGLAAFDPFARIRPRLVAATGTGLPADLLARLGEGLPPGGGTVHGDFHFGQLIRDGRGEVWIVDLDDMARGAPEADLGNLAAHLATRPETALPGVRGSLAHWRDAVLMAWGRPCDDALVERYMMIAALRRALKLRERGQGGVLAELAAMLSLA